MKKNLKLKLLQNSKTKIVTKLINLNCKKTEKLELGQNSIQFDKIQNVTKFNNSNFDKTTTEIMTKLKN